MKTYDNQKTLSDYLSGLITIIIGLFMYLFMNPGSEVSSSSGLDFNLGESFITLPVIHLDFYLIIIVLSLSCMFLSFAWFFLALNPKRKKGLYASIIVVLILALFFWASRDRVINVTGLLQSTVARSLPLIFGALCGVISERSGVMYIGIEGTLLIGAFASAMSASLMGNLYIGLIVGILSGGIIAAIFATLVIRFKVDQIIAGMGINLLATGLTSFLLVRITDTAKFNTPPRFLPLELPLLSKLPVIGSVFFRHNIYFYLAITVVLITNYVMYATKYGLRLRAVGEHPRAADTLGINVYSVRFVSVIIGGMVAGLGGTYFTLGSTGAFDRVMTAGRGFVGLAAMIFGGMRPLGSLGASLVFGFFEAFQTRLALLNAAIPSDFLMMIPYVLTIIVVAGFVGRIKTPAADGKPYIKE